MQGCELCKSKLFLWWSLAIYLILAVISIKLQTADPISGYLAVTLAVGAAEVSGAGLRSLLRSGSSGGSSSSSAGAPAAPMPSGGTQDRESSGVSPTSPSGPDRAG